MYGSRSDCTDGAKGSHHWRMEQSWRVYYYSNLYPEINENVWNLSKPSKRVLAMIQTGKAWRVYQRNVVGVIQINPGPPHNLHKCLTVSYFLFSIYSCGDVTVPAVHWYSRGKSTLWTHKPLKSLQIFVQDFLFFLLAVPTLSTYLFWPAKCY